MSASFPDIAYIFAWTCDFIDNFTSMQLLQWRFDGRDGSFHYGSTWYITWCNFDKFIDCQKQSFMKSLYTTVRH